MADGLLHSVVRFLRQMTVPNGGEAGDDLLLRRFTAGRDETAFATLLRRHGPMVYGVCRRVLRDPHDAEDAFQATFLVLVRKADSVGRPDLLGNWLYGVARRTARKAKTEAAKRRAKKRRAALPSAASAADPAAGELAAVVDEEVSRLPARYRIPFVLCCLEGKTNEEAARLIGCPAGTVASRLAWARVRLRSRLTRRGLGPDAGSLPAPLAPGAVPPELAGSTARTAMLVAAGRAAAGAAIPTTVGALTEGVLRAMFLTKLTTAAAMLLAVSVLAAGALCAYPALTARAKGAKEPGAPKGATGSEPAKGLKLTLSADKAETVIDVEGNFNRHHRVEPVALHLTFTNTGDKPIKVDAYDLAVKHLTMEASGPDADDCAPDHDSSEYNVEDAKAADYPTIKTGGHWSPDRPLSFPDNAGRRGYELFRTGEYRVRVTYRNTGEAGGELAAGSWTGGVTSNWIVLKVVPEAAKPVTAPAKAAEGPTSLDFHKEVPPLSALNIVFKPEARAARSDKKLTLSLKIENGSPDPITATLAHEWHGGLWPPTDLYASVTPAGAKDTRPFVPAYLVGEDQSAARATDVAPGKAVTADVRTDWPGTGSVHGEPLMESGRKYKVRTLLVFRAGGRQQYVVSAATEVEAPPE